MQTERHDGLVSPVRPFYKKLLENLLEDPETKQVQVFKTDSQAHKEAMKKWNELTPNQKRNMRRRLKK